MKRRKFYEVQSFFRDIRRCAPQLKSHIDSKVAIVYDYDSLASFRIQRQSLLLDCETEMKKYHKFFYDRNVPVDIVPAQGQLGGYSLLILPQMIVAKPEFQAKLRGFVEQGGTLVLSYRDFVKDVHNNLVLGKQLPVDFDDFAGLCVTETESLQAGQSFPLRGEGEFAGVRDQGGIFRELLETQGAEVLLGYDDPFYKDFAAVTRVARGKGSVYYLGCGLEEELLTKVLEKAAREQGISSEPSAPGVEVVCRGSGSEALRMVMNHNPYPAEHAGERLEPFACHISSLAGEPD